MQGGGGALGSRHFGRRLFVAMAVIALAYGGVGLYNVVHASRTFGPTYMGMSRAEVQYVFGSPSARSADNRLWRMHEADAVTTVLFDASDRLTAIDCRGTMGTSGAACPAPLGIHVGDVEDAIWRKLGPPSGETYGGDGKVMDYPEMGLRFALRRATIVAIEHRRWRGPVALAVRAATVLSP